MLDEGKVQMAGVRFGVCSFGVGRFAVGFVVIAGTEWGIRHEAGLANSLQQGHVVSKPEGYG